MPLHIYNSLTRRKESFSPSLGRDVRIFVCGPTVYDYLHLGHARTYIAFDIITRYLNYLGYRVRYLMNITDVADRIVQRAEELKREPMDVTKEFEAAFLEDMRALGIINVEHFERASDHIPEIIGQVSGLIEKGFAYETETGVYFEVNKFPKFGQLSCQTQQELGLRRLELCSSKRNPEDFSLWRKHDQGLRWQSPWGLGRPGWHVEDTAISMSTFGNTYDIHGGASELIFPHHEAEIAQAEALSGTEPFVRYWIHTGLLNVQGRKMSKSLGNAIHIREALKRYTAAELRYYFALFHYRQPVVMSEEALQRARKKLNDLRASFNAFTRLPISQHSPKGKTLTTLVEKSEALFRRHMDNDFDAPKALDVIHTLAKKLAKAKVRLDSESKQKIEQTYLKMTDVFGILS